MQIMHKNLPEHLGGHANTTHIDERVLEFAIDTFKIKSFLDIGCGPGGMVRLAETKGLLAQGIDGDFTLPNKQSIIAHDFTTGKINFTKEFDLGWSVEFLEHVEEKYLHNYMSTFSICSFVIITHALPGKLGYHHVNCQPSTYWIDLFNNYKFKLLEKETQTIRQISSMKRNFMRNTGLCFKRVDLTC